MNALIPAPPRALALPTSTWLLEIFAPLVRAFDVLAGATWKQMVMAAGAFAAEPVYALEEHDDRYVLKALIPGVSAAKLTVTADAGSLRLTGGCQLRFTDGKSFGYVREQPIDEVFALPPDADGGRISCQQQPSGLLLVTIPRHPCVPVTSTPSA